MAAVDEWRHLHLQTFVAKRLSHLVSCLVLVETLAALEYVTLLIASSLWCIHYGWRSREI